VYKFVQRLNWRYKGNIPDRLGVGPNKCGTLLIKTHEEEPKFPGVYCEAARSGPYLASVTRVHLVYYTATIGDTHDPMCKKAEYVP
jgi:hypothetical protein